MPPLAPTRGHPPVQLFEYESICTKTPFAMNGGAPVEAKICSGA